MDDFVRILTTKAEEGSAAHLGVLEDDIGCTGSQSILRQVIRNLGKNPEHGRQCIIYYLGGRINEHGKSELSDSAINLRCLETGSNPEKPFQLLTETIQELEADKSIQDRACVVIGNLSILLLQFSLYKVLEMIEQLKGFESLGCVIGLLHTDLHESKTVYALEEAAKSILKVEATWSGLQSKAFPQIPRVDGSLLLQDKRRTGRVQCKRQWYQLQANGSILIANELDQETPKALLREVSEEKGPATQAGQRHGMRIGLTAEELEAREKVALPYEQKTGVFMGSVLTATDKSEGSKQSGLGQILYVRDSESDHDSDEDPDDDLDI